MEKREWLIAVTVLTLTFVFVLAGAAAMTWSEPELIGAESYSHDTNPEITTDNNGNVYAVWTTYPYGRRLYLNRFDGEKWMGATTPDHHVGNSFHPDVAIGPAGDAHIVWMGHYGGEGYATVYVRFDGANWGVPSLTGFYGGGASIAIAPTGEVFIAQGGSYIHGDGTTWTEPAPSGAAGRTDLSVDSTGNMYLAYGPRIPAYRTWTGSGWSSPIYLDGYDEGCGQVEMFHSDAGTSDYFCLRGTRVLHWHYDQQSGWQGPTEVVPAGSWKGNADVDANRKGLAAVIYSRLQAPDPAEDAYVRVWDGAQWLEEENVSNSPHNRNFWLGIGVSSDDQVVALWTVQIPPFPHWLYASTAQFALRAPIDIKPGSEPNAINCTNENAVIPVAVLTTEVFDASMVDHTTVSLNGAGELHTRRNTSEPRRHEEDVDGDGDMDLVFHFRLGETTLSCSATEATLTGVTTAGRSFYGTDMVHMIERGNSR